LVNCQRCGAEIPTESAFCPSCGAPVERISDEDISKLVFRRFGKNYDEALEASYTACIYDLEDGTLHKNLLIYYPSTDMMPNEARYLDEAMRRFIGRHEDDARLKDALAHYKLGLICENGRKFKEAGKEYDRAVSTFPEFAPAYLRRYYLHQISKNWKKALNDLLKAGELDDQFTMAFFGQGLMFKHLKKRDEAFESYKRCLALDPDNAAAHQNMGNIYMDRRDFESAKREYHEVLRLCPDHPSALRNLEMANNKIGRGLRKFF
jgi:tetratricopeptide (TPR) repeat protein